MSTTQIQLSKLTVSPENALSDFSFLQSLVFGKFTVVVAANPVFVQMEIAGQANREMGRIAGDDWAKFSSRQYGDL
jgi:hypothetical protein